eukprot:170401-Chlamydomonas_euryale.AAC.9
MEAVRRGDMAATEKLLAESERLEAALGKGLEELAASRAGVAARRGVAPPAWGASWQMRASLD